MSRYIIMIKRLVFILFVFCTSVSFGQVNDAGLWTDIVIEKRFSQAFSLEYSHSSRFNENITELGSFINEIGIKYRLNKNSRVSVFYRSNIKKQLNNMYIPYNRFYFEYSHRLEIWELGLDLRLRFQTQHRTIDFLDFDA
ncbi:MAG: hypothetical protein C0596_04605 [Marinilabiliales bacterium]|nr:MAG: hypothetical protein C0596_04605 [Marinilabiliales bacterium]